MCGDDMQPTAATAHLPCNHGSFQASCLWFHVILPRQLCYPGAFTRDAVPALYLSHVILTL
jgi:hypothetical protein